MIPGTQLGERDRSIDRERPPGAAIDGDGVAIGVEIRTGGGSTDLYVPSGRPRGVGSAAP